MTKTTHRNTYKTKAPALMREMPKGAATEAYEQSSLFEWADLMSGRHPELRLMHAIPNGEYRHISTAARLKTQGVKAGVPDICLPVPRRGYHGLYVEMKRRDGGVLSGEQEGWIEALNTQGYMAVVCHGWEATVTVIEGYLKGEPSHSHGDGAFSVERS